MANVQITVELTLDGHPLPGSPFTQILDVLDYQVLNVRKSIDAVGVFAPIPTVDALTPISALLLWNPDAELIYRFAGQTDAGLTVPAGGLVLLSNVDIEAGATLNVGADNSSS